MDTREFADTTEQATIAIEPASRVDNALRQLAEKPRNLQRNLELASALATLCGLRDEPNRTMESLVGRDAPMECETLVATTLLRFLARWPNSWLELGWRVEAISLFDRALTDTIYVRAKTTPREQGHEKEAKLREFMIRLENDLDGVVNSLTSLNLLGQVRNRLLQTVNDKNNSFILQPFLPPKLFHGRVQDLFIAAESYAAASGSTVLDMYRNAVSTASAFLHESEQYGTEYSKRYFVGIAEAVIRVVTRDFANSPVSKPALVSVESSAKKYPFFVGNSVRLRLVITNHGPGPALNTSLSLSHDQSVIIDRHETYLGDLLPGRFDIEIMGEVTSPTDSVLLEIDCAWQNFDGSDGRAEVLLELDGQKETLDWDAVRRQDPYALEPVTDEAELIGRREILSELEASLTGRTSTSWYIHGQKRVGKTSIVRTLKSRLEASHTIPFIVVYLEEGQYDLSSAPETVDNLVRKICTTIQRSDPRLRSIDLPAGRGALSPLTDFLDDVAEVSPNTRIVVILDEFDELPRELFGDSQIASSFFQSIRAVSGKSAIGFVLVGGEKLEPLVKWHWGALNKFRAFSVGYFDRKKQWADFEDLVRRPVEQWLSLSDDAVIHLYEQTAGHPYFTKLICGVLFTLMVERRDGDVTAAEVQEAVELTMERLERNSFEHFWVDGLVEEGGERSSAIIRRQKVLIAITELLRRSEIPTKPSILVETDKWSLAEAIVEHELAEFVRRDVLILERDAYRFKVPLFRTWLSERGAEDLAADSAHEDAALQEYLTGQKYRVKPEEVVKLVETWGAYKGRQITADHVRTWLDQFSDPKDQRVMFAVLENVRFYNPIVIRQKLAEAHSRVIRGLKHKIEKGERRRKDILVSYPGTEGKSGGTYARLYADENSIWTDNVVNPSKLASRLTRGDDVQAAVFVDDFIGTGDSASTFLRQFAKEMGETRRRDVKFLFAAIAGFSRGIDKIEKVARQVGLDLTVLVGDRLDDSDSLFHEDSVRFPDPSVRMQAARIAESRGRLLEASWPLGYGHLQAGVVFESSCPNNTIPVLWKDTRDWRALFPRH